VQALFGRKNIFPVHFMHILKEKGITGKCVLIAGKMRLLLLVL